MHWGGPGSWPVVCPLRRWTGVPCATCGMTRAAACLVRGDLAGAFGYNLAAIPVALFALAVWGMVLWEALGRSPVWPGFWRRWGTWLTWLAVPLLAAAWIVNLVKLAGH